MPALRSLPPQFLLPAWNNCQLHRLRSLQLRSLHAPSDHGECTRPREQAEPRKKPGSEEPLIRKQPVTSNRFRKVRILGNHSLKISKVNIRRVVRNGPEVPIHPIHRDGWINPSEQDPQDGARSKNQGSYAEVKELENKSKPHHDGILSASKFQRSTERQGVSERLRPQVGHSTRENIAPTVTTPRVPLKTPKEITQDQRLETATNQRYSNPAPSRHIPIEAPLMAQQPAKKELSLFEELFPEEARKWSKTSDLQPEKQADLPRLPPLDFDILPESLEDHHLYGESNVRSTSPNASSGPFRQQEVEILVFSRASTSLSEADFRRVVPTYGEHIEGWRGPGDIMKVIPARDVTTLSPKGHYYLVFPNLAYAQAYQKHVLRLHHLAKTYNSTSPNWGLSVAIGRKDDYINGEDVHGLMQDYTLSPPSSRLTLRLLDTPYRQNVRKVLDYLGYPQIVTPDDKAGRSVLFWVNGYQPSTLSVKTMLAKDGQDRGLQWGPLRGYGSIDVFDVKPGKDDDEEAEAEATGDPDSGRWDGWQRDEELKPKRNWIQRWVISFEDEAEARRFVRVWHRMPYMFPLQTENPSRGEENMLVHAEFLW